MVNNDKKKNGSVAAVEISNNRNNKGKVSVHDFGFIIPVDEEDRPLPIDWPNGSHLMEYMGPYLRNDNKTDEDETAAAAGVVPAFTTDDSPKYWQASARLALLRKAKQSPLLNRTMDDELRPLYKTINASEGIKRLDLTEDDIEMINKRWNELYQHSTSNEHDDNNNNNNNNNDPPSSSSGAASDDYSERRAAQEDLLNMMKTSRSYNRQLQWAIMDCGPACQFKLHAHPNVELVYCARGTLHEVRMEGEPFTKSFGSKCEVHGPNLTALERSWYFDTLHEGQWLVNEVGSIHKSFTATRGEGCVLLVLWGGSHADVRPGEEPISVNVPQAVNDMDDKLSRCQDCTQWTELKDIFLPNSEK